MTEETQQPTQPSESSYYLSDGVVGQGDAPEWFNSAKYKTVSDQAKAYTELEKMHGEYTNKFKSFDGAPEDYVINAPEGIELTADDPLVTSAIEWGKDNNLSQSGMDSLIGLYASVEAAREQAHEEFFNEQIAQIDNYEQRASKINDFLKANDLTALSGQITTKDGLEQFEKLLDMAGKPSLDPQAESNTVPTQEEIEKLMFEQDQFGKRIYHYDAERQAKVKRLLQLKHGDGQYHQVVG